MKLWFTVCQFIVQTVEAKEMTRVLVFQTSKRPRTEEIINLKTKKQKLTERRKYLRVSF